MDRFKVSVIIWFLFVLPLLTDTNESDIVFLTKFLNESNCTNDACIPDEEYLDIMYNDIFPNFTDCVMITLHSFIFIAGLFSNSLVCLAVSRNHSMKTVTNYFIVNLAVADLLVILICLPPSVLWDVTEIWFLGWGLCKAIPYLQVNDQ
ncbi:hypothetical protein M0802_016205 [Mischocyttarus mexicanus]|nr:hypothetical protein M0802_016205 [Mischocyttarus mexicanus]